QALQGDAQARLQRSVRQRQERRGDPQDAQVRFSAGLPGEVRGGDAGDPRAGDLEGRQGCAELEAGEQL
ncbi:hypothetical protein LTR28_011399, partial [Elasticomyces elasticus]